MALITPQNNELAAMCRVVFAGAPTNSAGLPIVAAWKVAMKGLTCAGESRRASEKMIPMKWFALEQTQFAYRADFAVYGTAVASLAWGVAVLTPPEHRYSVVACVVAGWAGWGFFEYLLHRFVLHGVQPFLRWHEAHHDRPTALLFTPTVLSAASIVAFVLAPAWPLIGP